MYIPSEKKNKHNKAINQIFFFAFVPGFNENVLKMQTSD